MHRSGYKYIIRFKLQRILANEQNSPFFRFREKKDLDENIFFNPNSFLTFNKYPDYGSR